MNDKLYAVRPALAGQTEGTVSWTFQFSAFPGAQPPVTASVPPPGADGKGSGATPTIGADGTIYVGADNSNMYAVTADGQLKWLTWTPSAAVKTGTATNQLAVTAAGDHMSFVVNGIPVASQTDAIFHKGGIGVFVGGDSNEVALDRIAVSSPR